MAYRVMGFDHGKVTGERRQYGTVTLDHVYDQATVETPVAPLTIVPLQNPMANPAAWDGVPVSTTQHNGAPLATVQLGYDANNLYAPSMWPTIPRWSTAPTTPAWPSRVAIPPGWCWARKGSVRCPWRAISA